MARAEPEASETVHSEDQTEGVFQQPENASASQVQGTIEEADAAIRARNYQLAADALVKMQISGAVQNDQQAWDYNRRMTILQSQLAEAAAQGDARAQATIEFLKRTQRRGP